jgi:hypothetical protein
MIDKVEDTKRIELAVKHLQREAVSFLNLELGGSDFLEAI